MSNVLKTATIGGTTYTLGSVDKATDTKLGGIRVNTSFSNADINANMNTYTGQDKICYPVSIDNQGDAFVSLPPQPDTTIGAATATEIGGIKIGYTDNFSKNNYGVLLNSNKQAYVNVPSYKKTIQVFKGTDIELNQDTIFVNLEVGGKDVIIKKLAVDVGGESELILKGITNLTIDTSEYGSDSITNGLYWGGGKPTFDEDHIYNIKFTKFAPDSNDANNKIGKYLVSYTSNYVNNQTN